jgi:hypothetical protein
VDLQDLVADPTIDYVDVLDHLKQYRINKVRIWIDCYWGGPRYLHPWQYSGKFDLDRWNPVYWRRLRDTVAAAAERGIAVEISIFGPNDIAPAAQWSNPRYQDAWNKAFNGNGVFSANRNGDFLPQFFELDYPEKSLSGKTLEDYQQALVDKTLSELAPFPNVYFEVANEFPVVMDSASDAIDRLYPWQLHWAERIKANSGRLVAAHSHQGSGPQMHGVQYFWDKPYIDILNFHFYAPDPSLISRLLHAVQTKGKILTCNESFEVPQDLDKATRESWGWFVSGGYYSFYTSTKLVGQSRWAPVGERAKALRDIAEQLPFWQMSPVDPSGKEYDALVKQGPTGGNWQALARPGFEYVIFFWGTKSSRDVLMDLLLGNYTFRWYDPRNEGVLLEGSVAGRASTPIGVPSAGSWDPNAGVVLVVRKATEASGRQQGLPSGPVWARQERKRTIAPQCYWCAP